MSIDEILSPFGVEHLNTIVVTKAASVGQADVGWFCHAAYHSGPAQFAMVAVCAPLPKIDSA